MQGAKVYEAHQQLEAGLGHELRHLEVAVRARLMMLSISSSSALLSFVAFEFLDLLFEVF